ncbi:MAG: putative hydro-lyase [Thermovenabulum sp.]|uniref:putative hydro-lyase n=1 Tax=Thermovenabulum sp. TaxID=3100335 RepID=UPI003C7AC73F
MNNLNSSEARKLIREGKWQGPTCGMALGFVQANLAILPKKYAYDFLLFSFRNPKPCPLLDVLDAGNPVPNIAKDADIRTDIPKYRIYKNGNLVDEVTDIKDIWQDDFVSFLIGCSFTFEKALLENGIPVRHIEENKNVPMYITNIDTVPAGVFSGKMVVSMRPIPEKLVIRAIQVTSRFPSVHGAPVHIGDPKKIGIKDIEKPDFGDPVEIKENEVPVFWACGVTPQAVALNSKPEIMITHSPGHMFITDLRDEELAVL